MQLKNLGNLSEVLNSFKVSSAAVGNTFNSMDLATQKFILSCGKLSETQLAVISGNIEWITTADGAIVSTSGLTKAELDEAVANATLSASQKEAQGTTNGLSLAFKGLATSLGVTTAQLGIIIGVIAAVGAGIYVFSKLHKTAGELKESALETTEAFKSLQSEVNSLNSELKTTTSRMEELESKPNLTFIEQEELEKLKEAADELQRQYDTKVALLNLEKQKTRDETLDYFNSNDSYTRYTGYNNEQVDTGNARTGVAEYELFSGNPIEIARKQLEDYKVLLEQKKNLEQEIENFKVANYDDYENNDAYINMQLELEAINSETNSLRTVLGSTIKDFDELDDSLDPNSDGDLIQSLKIIRDLFNSIFGTPSTTKSFDEIWNSNDFSKYKSELEKLAKEGKLDASVLESNENYKRLLEETGATAESTAQHINALVDAEKKSGESSGKTGSSFTDIESKVQFLSEGLDQLDSIYADILDGEDFDWSSILNNDDFAEVFGNLTNVTDDYKNAYEDFIKTVSNSPNDINACQDAFNNLATAYIQNSGILDELTEETRNATVAQLEQMGIANAAEIADKQLAIEKERVALASSEIANTLNWENSELFASKDASDVATIAMAQLALEKLGVNENKIETSADIEQIIALANTALAGAEALAQLARAKDVLAAVESAGGGEQGRFRAGIDTKTYQEALDVVEQLNNGTYEFGFSALNASDFVAKYNGGVKSLAAAEKNAKDATDKATDALKEKKEALEETKSALEETKNEMDDLKSAIDWFFDKQEDKWDALIDKINKANEVLEKQKDNYDDILSAIENNIDIEIQALQDKIDALDKANGASEKEIALEKAKQALAEAKSRKSIMQYVKNKGLVYTVDENAIAEAQEEYDNANAEKVKEEINDQIDQLEELKNRWNEIPDAYEKAMAEIAASNYFGTDWRNITLNPSEFTLEDFKNNYTGVQANIASNDLQIEQYEAEKEKIEELRKYWDDAVNAYKYGQYEAKLSAYFGSDYEYQLLNNSASWSAKFASEYADICKQIEDIETQIKNLSADTASSIVSESEKATNALGNTGSALKNLGQKVEETPSVAKYLWTNEDDRALLNAQLKLIQLNQLVGDETSGVMVDARDKVQAFVDEYGTLKNTGEVTEGLRQSLDSLQSTEDSLLGHFAGVIDGTSERLSVAFNELNSLNTAMQSVNTSEQNVQTEVDNTISDAYTTVSDVSEKVSLLNQALSELTTSRQEIENIVNTELTDTDTLVSTSQEKITGIQTLITELLSSIGQLETSLINLISKMQDLDGVTLTKIVSAIGIGGQENSGLYGGIQSVLALLNGDEGLIAQLVILDQTPLDTIIAEFNGEEESLKFSIMDVITTISGEEGLIVNINRITETINNIETVRNSFVNLENQVSNCTVKVNELYNSIESLHDKTITITTVYRTIGSPGGGGAGGGVSISPNAKGGIISKRDKGDLDFIAQSLGEDHTIAVQEGEAVIPKESVQKNPELVNALIDSSDVESKLEKLGWEKLDIPSIENFKVPYDMLNKYVNLSPGISLPKWDAEKFVNNNQQQKSVTLSIGDIHVHGVQDTNGLSRAIVNQLPNAIMQELKRR